eukprot:Skav214288  [mRNA]  locus=scaffold2257:201508:210505:- [translate_table: standard]
MGGFSFGSQRLGIKTAVFVDRSSLACQAIQANFSGHVIQGDLGDMNTVKQAHAHRQPGHLQVTGGFACQGFSTQGDQNGMADRRSHSLLHILRGAWLLQADDILLECVANVVNFPAAQQVIDDFAEATNMKASRIVFDLKDQWPARRNRFWCHLTGASLPCVDLKPWTATSDYVSLGSIMPMDALWSAHEEEQLEWDDQETALYMDPNFGMDKRLLTSEDSAPTVLHSWGHITRDCACGCRRAFGLQRLRQGGVRGFGLCSARHGRPRHLHPCEGSVLCTVKPDFVFPAPARSGLCLLGQIAAPLQVLWLQSQILASFQLHHWGVTTIDPLAQVQLLQHELRFHAFTRWITPSMYLPRTLTLHFDDEDHVTEIKVCSPTTVHDLKVAEKQLGGWGEYPIITLNGTRLPLQMQLFPEVIYQIFRRQAKQVLPVPETNTIFGAGPSGSDSMLGDGVLWAFMNTLVEFAARDDVFLMHPFQVDHFLKTDLPDVVTTSWRENGSNKHIVTICELHGHWILIHGAWTSHRGLLWTFFDGLRADQSQPQLLEVTRKLSRAFAARFEAMFTGPSIPQQAPHVCGTIALLNLGHLLGLEDLPLRPSIEEAHLELLSLQGEYTLHTSHIFAGGPEAWQGKLRELLQSKGVPPLALDDRCQLVISKLGSHSLQNLLRKKNPWAELKAAASKPGTMFRLVTPNELKDYIDVRAQTKHGAQVHNHKQKKMHKQADRNSVMHLDPGQFDLNANHFKDEDDLPVAQIDFEEVGAEARGVALATVAMARSFLEQPTSISTDALALLIIDRPTEEIIEAAQLTKIVIPAKFKGTDEHTLIYGHIMQLGDSDVSRENASADSNPDVIKTQVIKMQVFKDQLAMPWPRFVDAPIRALVASIEPLQLCKGANCGASCGKFHPAVDETIDNVIFELWARSFFDEQGKKVPPLEACLFTAFMRVPEGALEKLLPNTPHGVYVEPRGERPKEHDDRYKVIWLPGASPEDAAHQCRTLDKAISLVRLKNKFGIRVKTEDEAAAWSHLRPGITFTPLNLQHIFELFPIPHGTQRNAIVKLLADWKWLARPLQPGRGSVDHMAWRVGAQTMPPQAVMTGFQNDVVITQVKDLKQTEVPKQLVASTKTQKHLRATQHKSGVDPWLESSKDPWARPSSSGVLSTTPASDGKSKLSTIQEQLKTDLAKDLAKQAQAAVQEAAASTSSMQPDERRIAALEVGMKELQGQQAQMTSWCQQVNERFHQQENTMGAMQQTLNNHQHELQTLGSTFQSTMKSVKDELSDSFSDAFNKQFTKLEALVEKKHRTGWLGHPGSETGSTRMPGHFARSRSSFGRLWLSFMLLFTPVTALQLSDPFARFYFDSSAVTTDRDLGSGDIELSVPSQVVTPWLQTVGCTLSGANGPAVVGTIRYGEAQHPGPSGETTLTVGVSNPGGLRQKEEHLMDLGPGIWSLAETQLSSETFRTSSRWLRKLGNQRNRAIRFYGGSPAPLRAGSTWAGKWTGVAIMQGWDPPCQVHLEDFDDPTKFLEAWAKDYEEAVFTLARTQSKQLPARTRGRAQRHDPVARQITSPACKPSREGEVRPASSLAGIALRNWFKQTPAAINYRQDLWSSIRNSRGFSPSFPDWWSNQSHEVAGIPHLLPLQVPEESSLVQALFDCFHLHFRRFEAWHLRERSRCLKAKYEGSLEAIYMDLKPDPTPGVNTLWSDHHYTILAVDEEGHQLQLDQPVQTDHDSVWLHNAHQVPVLSCTEDRCTVSMSTGTFSPGEEITQRVMMTDTNDILESLATHWRTRWNSLTELSQEMWGRIVGFADHYMPRIGFSLPPIQPADWCSIIKKFKPKAARGPDGFSKDDLIHMPTNHMEQLVEMLNNIEQTQMPWPAQLTFGTVIGLGKCDEPHLVSHFRPISLFSTIYRGWARLRTRQLLRQIGKYMPAEALGFLPHRETTSVWLQLQATIEVMLQHEADFAGLSTDLMKAFNHIGRPQIFHVARRLGLPVTLLNAWNKFLKQVVRCFDVHGCLGDPVTSCAGLPEGCPMSIIGMLMVNWCYHLYMQTFCPSVTAYSFVDNLTLAGEVAEHLLRAFFAMKEICSLFGLQIDEAKTYVWALTRRIRVGMLALGFPCFTDASELGGAMTYGRARRTRVLRHRGQQLHLRWKRLKSSSAPGPQKWAVLPLVFWPQALHGSSNCLISSDYVGQLRKEAVKALKVSGAGSNPMLRLSLAPDMKADPGFFQVQLLLDTFRRMLTKSPDILMLWKLRMRDYDGAFLPGPFSQLLQCMQMIGWAVHDPPNLTDHEGYTWNLLLLDSKTLRMKLEDAWLQFVASQVRHKSMADLDGLDGYLTKLDLAQLSALDRARLSALHSGAFVSNFEHSRYDETKNADCSICNCRDDRVHWLQCPRYEHLRRAIPDWCPDNVELPQCTLHHLLVPRQKILVRWRQVLCDRSNGSFSFLAPPPNHGFHHLFLDGSCFQRDHPDLNLAAWAMIDATSGQLVAAAPLRGITQTIDRAELTAVITALEWASSTEMDLALWSDSHSTVQVADYIQATGTLPSGVSNIDLWSQFQLLMEDGKHLTTWFRWVPGHLDPLLAEDGFEEWIIKWNDLADQAAKQANLQRPAELWTLRERAARRLDDWSRRLRQVRQFYFSVADQAIATSGSANEDEVIDDHSDEEWMWLPWEDHLPVDWQVRCPDDRSIPSDFFRALIVWILAAERLGGTVRHMTDLELVFALVQDPSFCFPFQVSGSQTFQMRRPDSLFQKPTLAMFLRPVQSAMTILGEIFSHVIRVPPGSCLDLGVHMKFSGTSLLIPDELWGQTRSQMQAFTATRPVRRSADLARPLA